MRAPPGGAAPASGLGCPSRGFGPSPVVMVNHCSRRGLDLALKPMAFSWNSELPSGRNPFWIRDEALAGVGLHVGDAVSVDTRVDPLDGDLVVAEAEMDGDSVRLARRYIAVGEAVRLEPVGSAEDVVQLPAEAVIVLGVIQARVRFEDAGARVVEVPLSARD